MYAEKKYLTKSIGKYDKVFKGSDWIRLVFAHPIASANFIAHGKVQVSPYLGIWGCFIIHTHDEACPTNGGSVIQDQRVGAIII